MANEAMNKPLDGAGLSVVNSVINARLGKKANKEDLPTKTSQLTNDSGYLTGADMGGLAYKDTAGLSDLDAAVKASLTKADTALQSYTETDPTVPAWAKEAAKPTYTATEVGAIPLAMADSFAKKSDITGAYIYRGSVTAYADLPTTGLTAGDVYNVEENDMNYGWTGTGWDPLGSMFQLDPLTEAEIKTIMGVTA